MSANLSNPEELLTPSGVAALFRVDPKTVTRWAKAGKLSCVKTLGGHRRYLASEVNALLEGSLPGPAPPARSWGSDLRPVAADRRSPAVRSPRTPGCGSH